MKTRSMLTLDDCKKISAAAEAEAKKNNWNVCITIHDDGGHLLHLIRMDGATPANSRIAIEKGRTAAETRRSTAMWEDRRVIVTDIAVDPLWDAYRDAALPFGLRVCINGREWLLEVGGLSTDRYEDVAADTRALIWNQLRLAALGPAVRPGDYRVATHVSEIKLAHERLPVANPSDELGRLAAVFNDLLARVGAAFEQQRQFIADASHELRTPVAIASGEAELALSREERTVDELKAALRTIREEMQGLQRIVEVVNRESR